MQHNPSNDKLLQQPCKKISLSASEAEIHEAISIHIKNKSLGNKSSAYYCDSSAHLQQRLVDCTFCTTLIAAWKEQKGIAGANHSSSNGVVYKGGLRGKSRLEKKRLGDICELPKVTMSFFALMLTGTLPYYQRRGQNMLSSIRRTSISDTRPLSMVFYT